MNQWSAYLNFLPVFQKLLLPTPPPPPPPSPSPPQPHMSRLMYLKYPQMFAQLDAKLPIIEPKKSRILSQAEVIQTRKNVLFLESKKHVLV